VHADPTTGDGEDPHAALDHHHLTGE
jgi:hypothetical protein